MQERVWAYLGGIARQNQLRPLLIGGTEDHIHVLLGIPPTVAICGIDKASRGVQASLARRDGYGPLIPWAEARRLPSNHRFAVPQEVPIYRRSRRINAAPSSSDICKLPRPCL